METSNRLGYYWYKWGQEASFFFYCAEVIKHVKLFHLTQVKDLNTLPSLFVVSNNMDY